LPDSIYLHFKEIPACGKVADINIGKPVLEPPGNSCFSSIAFSDPLINTVISVGPGSHTINTKFILDPEWKYTEY